MTQREDNFINKKTSILVYATWPCKCQIIPPISIEMGSNIYEKGNGTGCVRDFPRVRMIRVIVSSPK